MALTESDRAEIMQLSARYAHAIDAFDGLAWADCFTPDGAFESDLQGRFQGRDALLEFARISEEYDVGHGLVCRHWTTHWIIEGDADRATSTCYAMVVNAADGSIFATGIYRDRLVRIDGEWKFSERLWTTDCLDDEERAEIAKAYKND